MFSLLFVMALDISAQQPPARPIPPPRDSSATTATGTAVIRGRVFAADTKKPLRRARIVVSSPELGQDRRQTSTNIDGRFEVKDLPAGRYTVEVQRAGYLPLRYGQRRPREAAKPLQVLDRQRLDDIDFTLPRMSVIAGRVFDETSEAVEGATVFAMRRAWFQGKSRLVPAGSTITDDAGGFRLHGLAPGAYYLRANLRDTWTVTEDGADATFGYAPTYHPTTANVRDARAVSVGVGQEVANADVFLVPGRAVTVSGTAFDAHGRALAGQQVSLRQETRGPEMSMFFGGAGARVNPDGTFNIKNVVPGDYMIAATASGDKGTEAIAMPLVVGDADIDNLSLIPTPGASISGHVVTDTGAVPTFAPDRARIASRILDGDRDPRTNFNNESGRVKDDWSFIVTPLYAAAYLRITLPDGWTLKAILDRDGRDITDDAIDLRKGEEMADVRVVVSNNVTAVSGQLSDEKGQPITEGTVVVFADVADKWSEDSRFVKSARLDQQGKYEIKGLPPAAYLAVALDYVEDGIWNDPEFLESLRRYGTRLALAEGEARSVLLKLTTLTAQQ